MTGPAVFHVLIDKLGHRLEEIRIRALDNIISKLTLGFIKENDHRIRRELLLKILEWFRFEPCLKKEKALGVLLTLLKGKLGKNLILEVGVPNILAILSNLKNESEPNVNIIISQIETIISEKELEESSAKESAESENSSGIFEQASHHANNQRYQFSQFNYSEMRSQMNQDPQITFWNCLHYMYLPWQPLVATDNHVLSAVEESLGNMNDPDLVLHTCNFFMDVMLQDFPAEVFLQRPTLVKLFLSSLDGIAPGTNKKVCSAMLKCLHKLAAALLIRIHYYSDPSLVNSKQELCARSQTPSYLSQTSSQATVTDDDLTNEQIMVPSCDRQSEDDYISAGGDSSLISNMKSQIHNVHFGSHVKKKGKCDVDTDAEDSVLLQFQQMSLPMFCMQALHQAIFHRSIHLTLELIKLSNLCISHMMWASQDASILEVVGKVTHVLELLGDAIKQHKRASQTEEEARLTYLQTLAVTRRFLVSAVPLEIADIVIPRNLKSALVISLLDYSLLCMMPELHQDLLSYCEKFTGSQYIDVLSHYNNTINIATSMAATVNFLKNYDRLDGNKILDLAEEALPSLAFHKAASFVRIALEICANKMGRWTVNEDVQRKVTKIILYLLTHSEVDIKHEMYAICHTYIVSTFGVDQHNPSAWGPSHLSFLFQVNVLTEIICHGVASDDEKISKYSSDILIHFLKAKMLMPVSLWQTFIEQLIATMPLLECYADKSTNLGRTIVEMLNPKTAESICIPKVEVLKGNLRLLFTTDDFVRNEALSRLITLVSLEENSLEKLPDVASLHVRTLSTYSLFDNPLDVTVPRKPSRFYEISSLCQVVEVLKADTTEPRVHRSALSQIAAMLEDPHLHLSFLEQKGIDICLNIIRKAVVEKCYNYYPDSVISIINVLKNMCYHNCNVRFTLSQDVVLFYCILRALFMFGSNRSFRQDVAQLLCLLLYSDYILSVPDSQLNNSSIMHPFSLPELVVKHMKLPFRTLIHWSTSPHTSPSYRALLSHEDSRMFLRMCWTSEWFGGVKQILSWHSIKLTEQSEFSPDLRASQSDLDCLKCTALNHCSKQCLYSIQNGTTHQSVENAVKRMLGYVTLQALLKERNDFEFQGNWKSMPWETTLLRFFGTSPACPEDEDLLISLLQFLCVCVQHLSATEIRKPQWTWVYRILKDPSQPLPCMLKMDSATVSKNISREILQLCQDCCLLEHQLEEDENGKNKADVVSWVYLVNIISQNLKFSDTQHFYNLAFLDWMLSCLSHMTGSLGWSRGFDNTGQLMKDLIWYLAEIVTAFHCNKGGQGGASLASFMGMSVTRNAIICMNHILCEMQNTATNRSWEAAWFTALTGSDLEGGVSLSWLPTLWLSRDPIIRCSSLQLVAGLCSTQLGSRFLIQGLRGSPPDIWEVSLGFLLDHEEAGVVREQAAAILTNLSNHGMPNISSVCLDSNSPQETPPTVSIHSFLSLLEEKNFFPGIALMINCLYLGTNVKPGVWMWSNTWTAESSTGTGVSQDTNLLHASQEDINPSFLTTPNLIKAVCWYLNNLLTVSPEEIVKNLCRYGLIKMLFEAICGIPDVFSTRMEILQYSELLEMYIAVCTVLTKSVCIDSKCLSLTLNMNDCLKKVLNLLNPVLFSTYRGDLVHLRNRLWSRVFRLLSCFLIDSKGYEIVLNTIFQCNPHAFLTTVESSINGKSSTDLRSNALSTLTLLLLLEAKTLLFQQLNVEQGDIKNAHKKISLQSILDRDTVKTLDSNIQSNSGANLCRQLMHLYEVQSLRHCSGDNKMPSYFPKAAVMGALSSLLAVSHEAKKIALKEGLLENIMVQLKELHVHISVEAVDNLRKSSDRKRVNAVFQEVNLLFSLLTNFLYNAPDVKVAAVGASLADTIHKLWAWCYILPTLLSDTLKLLCTFTTYCIPACQSLVLTTPILGVNARRAPSSNSLLHEIVNLILRELEVQGKGGDTSVLALAFHLLQNACHSQECRVVLFKTALFQSLNKLHPSSTKKQKHWEAVEMLWLPFLIDCTFHLEGQLGLPKIPEALDIIIAMTDSSKPLIQDSALAVLRNITFHHLNRPRLLSSTVYLHLLSKKLTDGTDKEKNTVVQMVWALVANNQKAKLVMKNCGIGTKLLEIVNHMKVISENSVTDLQIEIFNYVLKIIYSERKLRKS
ncbi:hypothetical protein R5R35_012635 [Gryllus longicercus]|uniref:Rotatin N-terminal domain-containing protein n=1 Tax=Gryllus longicercus TaxID=2509291 RepID=A0AAN9YZA5_9ORTH